MNKKEDQGSVMDRRSLLKVLGAGLAMPAVIRSESLIREPRSSVSPDEFRARLKGPVCSVPTVYNRDFSIDLKGFKNVIESGVKAGCKVFSLTSGNNRYDRLSYDEIKQLTKALVEGVAGRGLTITATGPWWTGQAVEYAKYSNELGADAVQVHLPEFGTEDLLVEHFQKIANAGPPSLVLHRQIPMPLLERLVGIPSVAAYKEEYVPMYSRDVFERFGDRLNIFAGGQKGAYLMYRPYGMKAWYSTLSTFAPAVAKKFAEADAADDEKAMVDIIQKYDIVFFRRWSHAFWRAMLDASGRAQRWVRPPDRSFTNEEVKEASVFLRKFDI